MKLRTLAAGLLTFLALCAPVLAQDSATVVATCPATNLNYTVGGVRPLTMDQNGNLCVGAQGSGAAGAAGFPAGATPITSGPIIGTTGAIFGQLAAAGGRTTYICGYMVTSQATAAATSITASITGTITGQLDIILPVAALPAVATTSQTFSPCIPASAVNTSISVNVPAPGAGGNQAVYAWGYQL